uniref:interferon-induced very large GTPase 1-like isoform X2 n=1 Tax=Gasterosteus aculeatus aculeatus TaxID=481459 RepID=UPI001A98CD2D|nr:interferon-induced very large GTPase 1-like isoform X2 [Gasterosteus aculeatus aculeatus]
MDMSENMDMKSEEFSDGMNRKKQHQTLFGRLHLQEKLERKFSPTNLSKVCPPVKQNVDVDEKDVAYIFLQRLWMLDYRARYIPTKEENPELNHSTPVKENVTDDTEDDDLNDLYSPNDDFDRSNLQTPVHPMDVQMAVFHCSDSFLKQNMITKLSQCQYALPLLVPDPETMDIECPLWTFRQIRKTWKITERKGDSNVVTMKSMPICKAETPMVSFLRLGSPSVSKSQLMNTLINDRHNTFFHRNCPGSTKSRHLMDGVAEIAWYCPAGKPNDAFTDCVAFCNLHGDALSFEKQREILTDKSSVVVVLVETLEKNDKSSAVISALYKCEKPLICLIADSDGVEKKKGKYKMGLNKRSQSDVSEELRETIGKIMSGSHSLFQLESMNKVCGIKVDEEDTVCQKGKSAAMKIVNLLQEKEVSKIKDTYLPCQGQLWKEWSKIHKELYRLKGNIEDDKVQKEQELMKKRQEQVNVSCSEPMKMFIESLSTLSGNEKDYFLKWTQILIDALSTDDLSSILQTYTTKWAEVLASKKTHDEIELLKKKQNELNEISTKLQSATFGLEHIFREMGQIYEAHKSLHKPTKSGPTDWSKYPELAAELMISGHPMELMDGDAGHAPLTWISGLLEEVINKLGDKRVFVLSVLGLQSSGKSTMLNAIFGLQFAVSAGRCTKGAFMQLAEVSEEMKKDFKFDYVLVVDTEGLRAPELEGNANLHHDNVLATFVVGLGNMTLININGENLADMQDVLQIVVQAFMRMKKIKLSPSCVFVHQNVTDIGAAEKNMDGNRRLEEKLDEMAKLAAEEESSTEGITNGVRQSDFPSEEQPLIRSLIDDVEKQTIIQIKQRPVASTGYSLTYLQEAANTVKQKVTDFESKKKYALKKEFTVDLSLYIFDRAWTWISESHKEFKVNNDAQSYVNSKEMQFYRVFRNFCKGSSSAVVLGELICDKLKSAIVEAVCNKVAKDLTDTMKSNYPAFNGNRSDLEKHMLKSLAKKGDFNSFIIYIHQPRDHTETYIREEVQNYISTKEGKETGMKILQKNLDDIQNLVSLDLYNATEKVKTNGGDTGMWMEEFSSLLQAKLTFNNICCKNFSDLNSFDFLKEEIEKGLGSIVKQLRSLSLDEMDKSRMKPDQILIDQLCNCCWVKCPFCAAVCTNTLKDHSPDKHKVTFHRPSGITGFHCKGTKNLVNDFCTTLVASDGSFLPGHSEVSIPYKEYYKGGEKFASWEITPDESKLAYWKWFVCNFQKQLEAHYNMKFKERGTIPSAWKSHTDQEAIDSVDKL